jgi:hypothetical protein
LTIVGTRTKLVSHITVEAMYVLKKQEKYYFFAADAAAEIWIKRLNINSDSLDDCYAYDRMV